MIVIRPLAAADHAAVLELADRLTIGVAPWRSHAAVLRAVRRWVSDALEAMADEPADRAVFVAADGGEVVGFVSVTQDVHWTGDVDGYIGELVVREDQEGRHVGTRLVRQAEEWLRHGVCGGSGWRREPPTPLR